MTLPLRPRAPRRDARSGYRLGAAILVAAAAMTIRCSPGLAATGTDLGTGYRWVDTADGAVLETRGFDGVPATINPANDSPPTGPIPLPFTFALYRVNSDNIWISDNGWIGFDGPYASSSPAAAATIPDGAPPQAFIAPFWTQLRCDNLVLGEYIKHGPAAGGEAYLVEYYAEQPSTGFFVQARVYIYQSGAIKLQYQAGAQSLSAVTVGIENESGTDGCQIVGNGTPAAGVPAQFPANYVVDFEPPPVLPRQCATIPAIACPSTTSDSLPGPGPAYVLRYGCSTAGEAARERVYSFTVASLSAVDMTLTPGTGTNLVMHLLGACNERQCLHGPEGARIAALLGPGTYYVAVDAPTPADEGSYTLGLSCRPFATPIACPGTVSGDTSGHASVLDNYSCAPGRDLSGGEVGYLLTLASTENVHAVLSGTTADLDVLFLRLDPGEVLPSACLGWGDMEAVGWNLAPGNYLIVVDGVAGAAGPFTLDLDCRVDLRCGSPDGIVDFGTGRVQTLADDTRTGANTVQLYSCEPNVVFDGPELVYQIVLPQPGQLVAMQTSGVAGLSFFILSECNEGTCVGVAGANAGCAASLDAGVHYLVVDGAAGAAGAFDLLLAYEENFNRWDACEDPYGATRLEDTSSAFWNLSDEAFCITDPMSHNYPNGCTFAMYLTARCGTQLHIPLFDVEGGHIRVFDVFRGQYVVLTARSPTWTMTGTDIQWQDADCAQGSDPRWNEVITDVSFSRPEGLCGVYRLEFINHSGNVWELYSNCSGSRMPGFNIHDTLCAAVADYDPLPNITLVSATATFNCPDVTVTYTLQNDGCRPVNGFPVVLTDRGSVVGTDLASVGLGETVTNTFTTTFTVVPTTQVEISVDPGNVVPECDEGAGVACGITSGTEILRLPGCTGACQVVARATALPSRICEGQTVTIDAGPSSASLCTGTLEYQLRGPMAPIGWQAPSTFSGLAPTATANYDVDVRCSTDLTCTDTYRVVVTVDRKPVLDPNSVIGADRAACNLGIHVSWTAATFPSGGGVYSVYRSTTSCADAVAGPPLPAATGLPGTSFDDGTTTPGVPYYYVVEAEDGIPTVACTPTGATQGGSVARVNVNRGTCRAVVDSVTAQPALLPRIGGGLRLGGGNGGVSPTYGPTFVELNWTTDRPASLPAGEHFHVLRAEDPSSISNFTRISPDPLTAPTYGDFTAIHPSDPHCFFYFVFSVDACENDNSTIPGEGLVP